MASIWQPSSSFVIVVGNRGLSIEANSCQPCRLKVVRGGEQSWRNSNPTGSPGVLLSLVCPQASQAARFLCIVKIVLQQTPELQTFLET